jgi:hypothetical protein
MCSWKLKVEFMGLIKTILLSLENYPPRMTGIQYLNTFLLICLTQQQMYAVFHKDLTDLNYLHF